MVFSYRPFGEPPAPIDHSKLKVIQIVLAIIQQGQIKRT